MPAKTKENYTKDSSGASVRDSFQTPRYATELIIPFIPLSVSTIWEPAAGTGMIANVFKNKTGYDVVSTEINGNYPYFDFLENISVSELSFKDEPCIVTNPPFSLKKKFAHRCIELGYPFALLIPADWSLWLIEAVRTLGCQMLVPSRRIDYITPHVVSRVNEGENTSYGNFREIPEALLKKYSGADFHSLWLTRGFGLKERVNFVDLTNSMKDGIL